MPNGRGQTQVHDSDIFHGIAASAVKCLPSSVLDACRPALWRWLASGVGSRSQIPRGSNEEQEAAREQLRREIAKDLQRMDPEHLVGVNTSEGDSSGSGTSMERRLRAVERLLLAYGERWPHVGYCQGLNFVAAALLRVLDGRSALAVLSALVARLSEDTFSSEPEMFARCRTCLQIRIQVVLFADRPQLSRHLHKLGLDFNLFLPRWHTTMFSGTIAMPATARLWDHILGEEGGDAVLRLGLAVFTRAEEQILRCESILAALRELESTAGKVTTAADVDRMLHHEWPIERLKRAERPSATTAEVHTKLKAAPIAPEKAAGFLNGDWKLMLAGFGWLVLVKLQDVPSLFLQVALLIVALALIVAAMAGTPVSTRHSCQGPVLGQSIGGGGAFWNRY